ncbi:C40 family peptidase [Georgenia sp.]
MAGTAASAAEVSALPRVDVSAAVAPALSVLATASVSVPAELTWSLAGEVAAAATPAPVVRRTVVVAARTGARAPLADAQAAAPAQATAPAQEAAAVPAPVASASAIVDYARQFVGTPYVYGGSTPAAFDCSGFTSYVFAAFGISLPRSSSAQAGAGVVVSADQARPGDLVWWPGHIGIYTGGGNHIAARNPGTALFEGPIPHSSPTFIRVA